MVSNAGKVHFISVIYNCDTVRLILVVKQKEHTSGKAISRAIYVIVTRCPRDVTLSKNLGNVVIFPHHTPSYKTENVSKLHLTKKDSPDSRLQTHS